MDANRDDLQHIGINASKYKTGIRLTRAILDKISVKLASKRVQVSADVREQHYQIDSEHLMRWLGYKDSRQAMIAEYEPDFADTA